MCAYLVTQKPEVQQVNVAYVMSGAKILMAGAKIIELNSMQSKKRDPPVGKLPLIVCKPVKTAIMHFWSV